MSRAHAAEKVHGDQGGKADCHCFAHAVDFQASSDDTPPHLLASGMIFKKENWSRRSSPIHD
jgi:hypothetical protein